MRAREDKNGRRGRAMRWAGPLGVALALGLGGSDPALGQWAGGTGTTPVYELDSWIGIGRSNPSMALDVLGRFNIRLGVVQKGLDPNQPATITNTTQDLGLYTHPPGEQIRLVTNAGPIRFYTDGGVGGAGTAVRMSVESSGSVGIGTTSPNRPLEVLGGIHSGGPAGELSFSSRDSTWNSVPGNGQRWVWYADAGRARLWSGGDKLVVTPTGNVGIGTSPSSASALHIDKSNGGIYVEQNQSWINHGTTGNNYLGGVTFFRPVAGGTTTAEINGAAGNAYFAGNVGIGITNPQSKLAVDGTIKAKDVTVTETPWADHVFAEGYELMALSELGRYIEQHGRLPGVPSAAEVAEKGVSLGQTQVKLLEKVEELTLHAIELGRQNEKLRADNLKLREELEQRTAALEERLARLEGH